MPQSYLDNLLDGNFADQYNASKSDLARVGVLLGQLLVRLPPAAKTIAALAAPLAPAPATTAALPATVVPIQAIASPAPATPGENGTT